jgi:hypothetical protein
VVGKIDLDDVLFAICLDGLGKQILSNEYSLDGLFMHVSRPPKEGQPTYELLKVMFELFYIKSAEALIFYITCFKGVRKRSE